MEVSHDDSDNESDDFNDARWDLVLGILKWPGDSLRRLEDSTCKLFLKKLTDFYLPSSNMFSRLELESAKVG